MERGHRAVDVRTRQRHRDRGGVLEAAAGSRIGRRRVVDADNRHRHLLGRHAAGVLVIDRHIVGLDQRLTRRQIGNGAVVDGEVPADGAGAIGLRHSGVDRKSPDITGGAIVRLCACNMSVASVRVGERNQAQRQWTEPRRRPRSCAPDWRDRRRKHPNMRHSDRTLPDWWRCFRS